MSGWLIGFNDLDREQRMFLEGGRMENGQFKLPFHERISNEYILGFPGSGKTILMLYSVAEEKCYNPDATILIVEFTHALIQMIKCALKELREYKNTKINAADIKVVTYYDYWKNYSEEKYDLILCDEVQDVPLKVINRMNKSAKRVVLAGDHNQSIYKEDPKWRENTCTTEDIMSLISPEVTHLKIVHRLCRHIIDAVDAFKPNMNILEGRIPMIKDNVQIRLWKATKGPVQEARFIIDDAIEAINVSNDEVGILLSSHKKIVNFANRVLDALNKPSWVVEYNRNRRGYDFSSLNRHLADCGVPMQYVANGYGDLERQKTVVLTTYHSSKGLDFDKVFLPFCNHTDEYSQYDEMAKRVFMVAMTRSRKDLILSYSAELNHFVERFRSQCNITYLGDDLPVLPGMEENKIGETDIFGF